MSFLRTWRRSASVVLMVVVLGGCASIPSSGPVVPGQAADVDREGQFQIIPEGPVRGASPQDIVTGFIRAAVGFSNDHRVARSFLTPQRQLTWRPDDSVGVYPTDSSLRLSVTSGVASTDTPTPAPGAQAAAGQNKPDVTAPPASSLETATVTVRTPVEARIDDDGRYASAAPGARVSRKFTVVRTGGGEWRIGGVDNGILIKRSDFDQTFRPFAVYFPDPTGRFLVPDVHWLAASRDLASVSPELPTALVRSLLEGPAPWLQGAVTTGVPPQTRMALAAVVVNDDVATVDLTEEVRAADPRHRRLLLAQLEATLGQLSTISRVRITVQRLALDVPSGSNASGTPGIDPVIDSRPVLIAPTGKVARLERGTVRPVGGLAGLDVRGATAPAVAYDGSAYAVLNARRDRLLVQMPGSTDATTAVKASSLTAPSFDVEGRVWTAAASGGRVFVAGAATPAVKLKAAWLRKYTVVALRISRDGTRAAVAVRSGASAHVFVSGVLCDAGGRPAALSEPLGLLPDLVSVSDVTWVDDSHVAVLGRRSTFPEPGARPWVVQVGGAATPVTEVPGAVSLTAGNGETSLLAATSSSVYLRVGARWIKAAPGRTPAYPG